MCFQLYGWRLSPIIKRGEGTESLLPVAVTKAQVTFINNLAGSIDGFLVSGFYVWRSQYV